MKYKVGDKVRIVDKRTDGMNYAGKMDCWLGKVMTITGISFTGDCYSMKEDSGRWDWYDNMIVGKVEEEEKRSSEYYLFKYLSAKLSEKEAELNARLSEIKKIQEEIKKVLDNES